MGMDDRTADVLDYFVIKVSQDANNSEQDVTLNADEFYNMRGIRKHKGGAGRRGGYKSTDRSIFTRDIERLATLWVRLEEYTGIEVDEKNKRRRIKRRGIDSRVIMLSAREGQLDLSNRLEPTTYRGRLGPLFAASIFGAGRQTALLSVKALSYDPYRQVPEKRLTRYLSWQWRIRQASGNYLQPFQVSTLLEGMHIEIDKNHPKQTKERLEKALNTLENDQVTAGWQYNNEWNEEIVGQRGWIPRWESCGIIIEPPQKIQDQYQKIKQIESNRSQELYAVERTFGERLRDIRLTRGLTQMRAAEEIGINQATYSRAEKGRDVSPKIQKRIEVWLKTTA